MIMDEMRSEQINNELTSSGIVDGDSFRIRFAEAQDIGRIAEIEALCFPADEAASLATLAERFAAFPENFLVAELDGSLIGFINGCTTSSPVIYDDLYHGTSHHEPHGPNLTVFGIDVDPAFQRRGVAAALIRRYIDKAAQDGRQAIILTCKEHLIHYYAAFGFTSSGVSDSTHGGAIWYDMTLNL
jgi:predicted N-acetyltransferase YhbS